MDLTKNHRPGLIKNNAIFHPHSKKIINTYIILSVLGIFVFDFRSLSVHINCRSVFGSRFPLSLLHTVKIVSPSTEIMAQTDFPNILLSEQFRTHECISVPICIFSVKRKYK